MGKAKGGGPKLYIYIYTGKVVGDQSEASVHRTSERLWHTILSHGPDLLAVERTPRQALVICDYSVEVVDVCGLSGRVHLSP